MSENPDQMAFPGLELDGPLDAGSQTPTERAAVATLTELRALGLLRPEHALTVQLVLDLSRAVGAGVTGRNTRASAVAMAAKQLVEVMAMLPMPDPGDSPGQSTDWDAFLDAKDRAYLAAHEQGVA